MIRHSLAMSCMPRQYPVFKTQLRKYVLSVAPCPSVFVLHDRISLVAKRLEHIPNSDPPRRAHRWKDSMVRAGYLKMNQSDCLAPVESRASVLPAFEKP